MDAKTVKKTHVGNLRDTRPIGSGADACFRSMTGLGNESAPSDTVQTAGAWSESCAKSHK